MDALRRSYELLLTASFPDLIRTIKALDWTLRPGSPRVRRSNEVGFGAFAVKSPRV